MKLINGDLSAQIQEGMAELEARANEIHAIRSLLQAAHAQILRKDETIKALEKKLKNLKDRKEE